MLISIYFTHTPQSFGELSFNENGIHTRRNASVISDGIYYQARFERNPTITNSSNQADMTSDVSILLTIPENVYMSDVFAHHSAKHQTKDKISFLQESLLFKHWAMDQLIKMAYAMKRRHYDKGSKVICQGQRMEYVWLIKQGAVRVSHIVSRAKSIQKYKPNCAQEQDVASVSLVIDLADLGQTDCIGLIESIDENAKKSQREAVTLCASELFFLP